MTDTRQRFISAATKAFAERGFYGTSIAAIAEPLPFTKQALLHHFGSKEKLYAEVLKGISDGLMGDIETVRERVADPREALEETFIAFYRRSFERRMETQLLMRELLDNRRRAETARTWYLKPFLEILTDMVLAAATTNPRPRTAALALVFQLLGAITYFIVSEPTLSQMFGRRSFTELRAVYEDGLRRLVRAGLNAAS